MSVICLSKVVSGFAHTLQNQTFSSLLYIKGRGASGMYDRGSTQPYVTNFALCKKKKKCTQQDVGLHTLQFQNRMYTTGC